MKILQIYCLLAYIAGLFLMHKRLNDVKKLDVRDIILFILAPLCVSPILLMPTLSLFMNLNYVILKK